jgi:hypothetical protein
MSNVKSGSQASNTASGVYRDIRISAGDLRVPALPAPRSRAAAFAETIRRRHGSTPVLMRPLEQVFRRGWFEVHRNMTSQRIWVNVVPHLTVRLRSANNLLATTGTCERPVETHIIRRPLMHLQREQREIETFAQRFATRQLRASSGAGNPVDTAVHRDATAARAIPKAGAQAVTRTRLIRPVPRVVRRTPVPAQQESSEHMRHVGQPPAAKPDSWRSGSAGGEARNAPTTFDVNRLTEQVVQAIDRRIIAQRERLGRI